MTARWGEVVLALGMAGLVVALAFFPVGLRAEDLELEVVSVHKVPKTEENLPYQVEVRVRWRWLKSHGDHSAWNLVSVGADSGRWHTSMPESGAQGVNGRLLTLLGQPAVRWGIPVIGGEDGEETFLLAGRGPGYHYDASSVTLQVHYSYQPHKRFGWPRRAWVQTVSGTYSLTAVER